MKLNGQSVLRYLYGAGQYPLARIDDDGKVIERYVYATNAHVPDAVIQQAGALFCWQPMPRAALELSSKPRPVKCYNDSIATPTDGSHATQTRGVQPFGFKGAITDPVSGAAGFSWMGARAYRPGLARFQTPDPAGVLAGWNQNDALAGDPINRIDPSGLLSVSVEDVHDTFADLSTGAAAASLLCVSAVQENPTIAPVCAGLGGVAAAAGAGALVTDLILFARGEGEPLDAISDVANAVTGGVSRIGQAVTRGFERGWQIVEDGANLFVDGLTRLAEWIKDQLDGNDKELKPCPNP